MLVIVASSISLAAEVLINDENMPIFSFAHLGDGKTHGLLTNVRDHFRQTGVLDRCTGPVY